MLEKAKAIMYVTGYIAFIVFGIANIFAGIYFLSEQPIVAIVAFAASLLCISRGAAELLEYLPKNGKR